ncbi:MAG: helix-turn-helix domain-containing protein [Synergistaceae bacterium]|nr:helix-turn-helix domain-containing protein [Synergistaceae bacterium]
MARDRTSPKSQEEIEGDDTSLVVPLRDAYRDVVGAVKATGKAEDVRPWAILAKRQIESVLRAQHRMQTTFLKESAIHDVIEDFVNYVPGLSDLDMLKARARCLGFSPDFLYVPIVFDMCGFRQVIRSSWERDGAAGQPDAEDPIQSLKNDILLEARSVFDAPNDISVPLGGDKYAVFCSIPPRIRHDEEEVFDLVNGRSRALLGRLEARGLSAVLGIGFFFQGIPELSHAYRSAWEAVALGKSLFRRPGIYDIQDLWFESLLLSVPQDKRERFIHSRLTQFDLGPGDAELKRTIVAYGESLFNRQSTAERLHVHRNTLGYRLAKIEERTRRSLRSFHDYIELYMACVLSDIQPDAKPL